MDLLKDLDQLFDDEKTFVGGNALNMTAAGNELFGADADPAQEFEFKIKLMEHDLQAVQMENNSLVQTVMKLRQELKEKNSVHDEFAVKIINQEISELKREIGTTEDKFTRLTDDVNDLKYKLEKVMTSSKVFMTMEDPQSVKLTVDQLEQSNKVAIIELCDLKERNKLKQKQIEVERTKQQNERVSALEKAEKESLLVGELRKKIMTLTTQLKLLEDMKNKRELESSVVIKSSGSKFSKDHLKNLRQTNERLMGEIIRLNGIIREQKAADKSRMEQSLSISAINFNEQSFDQTFLSKFK